MTQVWKVGTRKSKLAQIQTDLVIQKIQSAFPDVVCQKVLLSTKGDVDKKTSLTKLRGQGVFVKKIQAALLTHQIDFAVHSAKDLSSVEPTALTLAAFPERAAVNDCLLTTKQLQLTSLPQGARVGTGSLRRQFQLLAVRPDLKIASLRGNIETRLGKLIHGEFDAIVMAQAGLDRYDLQLADKGITVNHLPLADFLPAVGQGAIAIECLAASPLTKQLKKIDNQSVRRAVTCERAFLAYFGVGCNVPLAAYAILKDQQLVLSAQLGDLKTRQGYHYQQTGSDPVQLGRQVAQKLEAQANL